MSNNSARLSQLGSLTAVVPVHEIENKFENLSSWLKEVTQFHLKVILVLDLGNDNSLDLLQSHLEEFPAPNVSMIIGNFGSPGQSRNAGLELSQTEWVCFWDADDLPIIENFLEMLQVICEDSETNLVVGNFLKRDRKRAIEPGTVITRQFLFLAMARSLGIWRMAFRRSRIGDVRFTDHKMGEDQLFVSRLNFSKTEISLSSLYVYVYEMETFGGLTQIYGNSLKCAEILSIMVRESKYLKSTEVTLNYFLIAHLSASVLKRIRLKEFENLRNYVDLLRMPLLYKSSCVYWLNRVINAIRKSRHQHGINYLHLAGGLGNQLFQLTAALAISGNSIVLIEQSLAYPRLNSEGEAEISSFNLPRNVFFLPKRKIPQLLHRATNLLLRLSGTGNILNIIPKVSGLLIIQRKMISSYLGRRTDILLAKGIGDFNLQHKNSRSNYLIGLFQSSRWLYSDGVFSKIKKISPRPTFDNGSVIKKLRTWAELERPLVVHIRLGDYKFEERLGILGSEYYKEAIEEQLQSGLYDRIWLFTNEMDLASKIIPPEYLPSVRWVTEADHSASLTLEAMRLGHGYVIGNSTFSWWGAALSHNTNPIVIAPWPWFHKTESPIGILPSNWLRRNPHFAETRFD